MSGNRRTNKKQNRLSFLGFFLLFLISMGLVAYAAYNTFYYIPDEAYRVEGVRVLNEKERQEVMRQLIIQMDSISNSLAKFHETTNVGKKEYLKQEMVAVIRDYENNAISLGIGSDAFTKVVFLAMDMDGKIRKQQENLEEKTKDLNECKEKVSDLKQEVAQLRQGPTSN